MNGNKLRDEIMQLHQKAAKNNSPMTETTVSPGSQE
jgi:hypothetical protein